MVYSLLRASVVAVLFVQPTISSEVLPWEQLSLPPEVVQSALIPDKVFCESPCDWRKTVGGLFRPLVRDCADAREAVLKIAANMTAVTGVYYSMERRKPNMNALEALAEKKVSCTGQSILLVCALRSVGIPARVAWVMTWNHVPGNHTWAEAWVDGQWRMIEFNEKDFNTPWVMESIGMLNPELPEQRVYAAGVNAEFAVRPLHLSADSPIPVEDVTDRYLTLSLQWYAKSGLATDYRRLLVDVSPRSSNKELIEILDEKGVVISRAFLPTVRDDVRRFASLNVPREGRYFLQTPFGKQEIASSSQPVNIIRLSREAIFPETKHRSNIQQHPDG